MVQAGAVMTTQKRKELIYVPRLENPNTRDPDSFVIPDPPQESIPSCDQMR